MKQYPWPGNIRELENLIRRYVIFGSETSVILDALISRTEDEFDVPVDGTSSLKEITRRATRALERRVIRRTLEMHGWNRKRAARALHISYRALLYKIKDTGIGAKASASSVTAGKKDSENERERFSAAAGGGTTQ